VPFLRVIRDKRGYETTYLMHWYREGNRQRSRILYVFRSPGGVRVGRDPLEPEILRQLETHHPDIAFDWKAVRENQQVVETAPEQRRRRPRSEGSEPGPPVVASPPPEVPQAPARPPIPATIEGDTPDAQMAFLTEWYPQVRERVLQRSHDPARQEALLALAERLNPVSWTDADEIASGLQQAGESLERLSHVFAKRRRRARKKGRPPGAPGDAMVAPGDDAPLDAAGDAGDSGPEAEPDAAEPADAEEGSSS
jgi:hypothetical protein